MRLSAHDQHRLYLIIKVTLIAFGAMVAMDMLGVVIAVVTDSTYDWCVVGRLVGYLLRGEWLWHGGVMRSALPHENALGWITHYSVGFIYAFAYVELCLDGFNYPPRLFETLGFAWVVMVFPLCVLAPMTGNGFFDTHTDTQIVNLLYTLCEHTTFGLGLWGMAKLVSYGQLGCQHTDHVRLSQWLHHRL